MPLGGVIFDWDGVVIDSASLHEKSWELLAEELMLELPDNHFKLGFGKKMILLSPKSLSGAKTKERSTSGEKEKKNCTGS